MDVNIIIKEIISLIQIRKYLSDTMGNPTQNRKIVTEMNNTLLLIDKMIINLIQNPKFKDYINFEDIKNVIKEAANTNNIKSGLINKK